MSLIEEITCLDVLRREISCQQEKIACLEDAARYMSLSFVDRGGRPSGPGDKVGRMSAKILDEREKLEKMAEQYALTVERAVEIIGTLHNTLERKVLMRRYVLGKAWQRVAEELEYTQRNVLRAKHSAFQKLTQEVT